MTQATLFFFFFSQPVLAPVHMWGPEGLMTQCCSLLTVGSHQIIPAPFLPQLDTFVKVLTVL